MYIMTEPIRCEICKIDFRAPVYYKRHLNTSRHQRRMNCENAAHTCECGKIYSYNQSLYVHRKTCDVYQQSKTTVTSHNSSDNTDVQDMKQRLELYEKDREEMKAQIALLLESHMSASNKCTTNIETQNIIDTQNNIENQNIEQTINININAFGKENVDYLDDAAIADCIGRVYKSIPAILREIHFNPEHPENHNIKITNRKLPYASVMGNDQTWKIMNKKEAIETMVYNGYNLLDEKYPETKNKLSSRRQQHFEGFQDKFLGEDKDIVKQVKNDVEIMILNGASVQQETDA